MQTVTVSLTDVTYQRLQRAAELSGKSIDEIATQSIQESLPPLLDVIPLPHRTELQTMDDLGDEELWDMASRQVEVKDQRRYQRLLKKKNLSTLTDPERRALSELRVAIDRVMFQKAYAYLLLKWRGYRVPTLSELESRL